MSLHSDKRGTRIDLTSIRGQSLSTLSPPQPSQKGKEIKFPSKRKPSPVREHPRKVLSRGLGSLSKTTDSEAHLNLLLFKNESPWDTYRKEFSCDLAGDAAVVVHRRKPSKVLLLRSFPGEIADKVLQWFNQLQHPNIMSAKECFSVKDSLYALCEDLPLTLEHLIVCRAYLTEVQLGSILSQVLEALSYLITEGFEHRSIKSSNILMGLDGVVKIGCLEEICAQGQNRDQHKTLKALETITMELMGGAAGMNDYKRWPLESDAVRFLLATASAGSVDELRKHPLITKCYDSEGELVGLARFALVSARTFYSYP